MVSKSDANRYLITPEVIDYLFKKASPGLSAKDRKIFEDLTKSMRAFADKRAGGHVLTDPDLLQEVIKRFSKVGVGDSKDLIKAIMSIPKVMEQVEGKTSKAFQNAVEKSFTKALITLPEDYLKSIKELSTDVNSLNKNIERLIKSNDAKADKIVSLKNTHSADTASLREKHANEVSELKSKHQKNIEDQKERYEGKISNLQDAHAATKKELAQEKELVKLYEEEVHDKEKEIKKEQSKRKFDAVAYAREDERKNKTIEAQAKENQTLKEKMLERDQQHSDKVATMERRISRIKTTLNSLTGTVNKKDSILGYTSGELAAFTLRNFAGQKGLRVDSKHSDYKTAIGALAAHFHSGGKRTGKDIEQLIGHLLPNFTRPDGTSKLSGKGSGSGGSGGKGGHVVQQLQKFEKAVVKNMKLPNPTSDTLKMGVLLLGQMNPILGYILTAILAIKGSILGKGSIAGLTIAGGVAKSGIDKLSWLSNKEKYIQDKYFHSNATDKEKAVGEKALRRVRKKYFNNLGSSVSRAGLKKIPLIGALAGSYMAYKNFRKGDTAGGLGELSSGLLGGLFPGLGTAGSTLIDTWLGARDGVTGTRTPTSWAGNLLKNGSAGFSQRWRDAKSAYKVSMSASGGSAAANAVSQTAKSMTAMEKTLGVLKGIMAAIKVFVKPIPLIAAGIAGILAIVAYLNRDKIKNFFNNRGISQEGITRLQELEQKKRDGGLSDTEKSEYDTLSKNLHNSLVERRKKNEVAKGFRRTQFSFKNPITWHMWPQALANYTSDNTAAWLKSKDIKKGKESTIGSSLVDPSEIIPEHVLLSKGAGELETMMALRKGAYEKLQDKAGYWTVSKGLFAKTYQNPNGNNKYKDTLYVENGVQSLLANAVDQYGLPAGFNITSGTKSKGSVHQTHTGREVDIAYGANKLTRAERRRIETALKAQQKAGILSDWLYEGDHYHLSYAANKKSDLVAVPAVKAAVETAKKEAEKVSEPVQTAANGMREALWNRAMGNNNSKLDKTRNILFSATDITGSLGVWGITRLNSTGGT